MLNKIKCHNLTNVIHKVSNLDHMVITCYDFISPTHLYFDKFFIRECK
jgi:hypothetical protein